MCLCSSARPHPLSSPPELPGTFSVLRLGGPDPQLSTKIVGESISNGNPHIPRAPLVAKASEALQREAKLSLFLPPFSPGPGTSEGTILSPFSHQGREGSKEKVAFEELCCVCVCSLPCLLYRIRTPFLWGSWGNPESRSLLPLGLQASHSSRPLGPPLGTDATTEIWLFKSEI